MEPARPPGLATRFPFSIFDCQFAIEPNRQSSIPNRQSPGAPGRSRTGCFHLDRVAAPLLRLRERHPISDFGLRISDWHSMLPAPPSPNPQSEIPNPQALEAAAGLAPAPFRSAGGRLRCSATRPSLLQIFDCRVAIERSANRKSKLANRKSPGLTYGSRTRSSRLTFSRAHPAHSGQHMVGTAGFEPTTSWFQARRSAQPELHPVSIRNPFRHPGVEPGQRAYKARPFDRNECLSPVTRLVGPRGFEPRSSGSEPDVLPLNDGPASF